jgi:hypothetical protein
LPAVLDAANAAVGSRIPEGVRRAGRFGADDLDRHALGIGGDHAQDAVGHRNVDAAGDHRRESRRAALSVEDFDVEADRLEVALLQANVDEGAVPETALRDSDLQCLGIGLGGHGRGQHRQCGNCFPHCASPPAALEHFQKKWIPVFRSKMRQTQEPRA